MDTTRLSSGDTSATPVISVTVIDDHPATLAGIQAWLADTDPAIQVIAAGSTIRTAWLPPGDSADVVVLDLKLGNEPMTSYAHLRHLTNSSRRVVVYTMLDAADIALTCLDLGAATFLTKAEGPHHLIAAITAAATDQPYLPPALAGAIGIHHAPGRPALSDRERQVLIAWFQSESKYLVAQQLGIAPSSVGTYLDRIRLKYANSGRPAPTKATLLARALQDGL
jgi:two-component system, NarL family, nitrate/nitrite response regulator NarL